jgi:hypothetical protein
MTARANSSEEMMLAGSESLPADRLASRGAAIGTMFCASTAAACAGIDRSLGEFIGDVAQPMIVVST